MRANDLRGDLGSRIPRAHDQHAARAKLRRILVLRRMQLHDVRRELLGEGRSAWCLKIRHRDHHVLGLIAPIVCRHDIAPAFSGNTFDFDAGAHRQLEVLCVRLEIVAHLVLGRELESRRRETAFPRARRSERG